MKINITKESRRVLFWDEIDVAKAIVAQMKEDETTAAEYGLMAARAIASSFGDYAERVLECQAEIAKNARVLDPYGVGAARIDVWVTGIAKCDRSFIEFGAYLTDIWGLGRSDEENAELVGHMFKYIYKLS